MKEEELDLGSDVLMSRYPPDLFASTRLGIPAARFATRTGGDEWRAEIRDMDAAYSVLNLSRIGICLAGSTALKLDQRYALRLTGPAGESEVEFYVLRCQLQPREGTPDYHMAGLFTDLLERDDLPG